MVVSCSADNASVRNMRSALKKKYGNARAVNLKTRQKLYDLGMPPTNDKMGATGKACKERTNVIEWMQKLEDEKNELFQICPEKHRDSYKYGTESHLVRVVTENIHSLYNEVVRSVEQLHRMRAAGGLEATNVDFHEHSFSDDHLPPWEELKDAITQQYDVNCRQWGITGLDSTEQKKVPVMMGANTGGASTCWSCGETGHRRGDDACKAGKNTLHHSAPEWIRKRMNGGASNGGNRGKDGGAAGKQVGNFFKAHGTCKFGSGCIFAHDNGSSQGPKFGGLGKKDTKRVASLMNKLQVFS